MPKSIETEIKIKIHNLQKISEKLKLLGFHIKINRSFEDNWIFDSPNQDLSRRHWLLRIRTFNNRAWITLKTPSENSNQFKVREELETEIGEPSIGKEILHRFGIKPSFHYQKFRTDFTHSNYSEHELTVTLDETPIGNFLEIEGSSINICSLAAQLGYETPAFIVKSYMKLYRELFPDSSSTSMIFTNDALKNPS